MEDLSILTRPAPGPDLTLRYGAAAEQVADVWLGGPLAAGRPLAVLVHGGFWRPEIDRTHTRPQAVALREAGWTVVSVEYRRVPGRPELSLDDVGAVLTAVPELLAAAVGDRAGEASHNGSVVVLGHSAGGQLALWAAAVVPIPGLVGTIALAPVADLELAYRLGLRDGAVADFLGGSPQGRGDLDPVRMAGPPTPVVIVHGKEDEIVPFEVGDSYAVAHPATRMVPMPGVGHFALIDPLSEAWHVVVEALSTFGGSVPDAARRQTEGNCLTVSTI
ncbi:alpha/beta hydrolase [Kitasatospora sp. MAP5-34]|uniref:alpha/beta hydrolase family protein n=1 Tax=Kitasatospora sp. MAP5-34 TaxID=3035102 RepID=UPI0024740D58|nr:alpha/beta hydrolase [Kitasatospora sp. MAP5-34]